MVNEGKHANHRIWHILQLNIGKAAYTNADEFLKNNSFKGPPPLFIGEQIFAIFWGHIDVLYVLTALHCQMKHQCEGKFATQKFKSKCPPPPIFQFFKN